MLDSLPLSSLPSLRSLPPMTSVEAPTQQPAAAAPGEVKRAPAREARLAAFAQVQLSSDSETLTMEPAAMPLAAAPATPALTAHGQLSGVQPTIGLSCTALWVIK